MPKNNKVEFGIKAIIAGIRIVQELKQIEAREIAANSALVEAIQYLSQHQQQAVVEQNDASGQQSK